MNRHVKIIFLAGDLLIQKEILVHIYIKGKGGGNLAISSGGIYINTISGGIVNFGGAICISPISITKGTAGSDNVMENPAPALTRLLMEGLGSQKGQSEKTGQVKSIEPVEQIRTNGKNDK